MNLYFLVEGKTERKVYPQWLRYLLPDTFSRVNAAKQATSNNYYLISGGGYPSILDNHLRNAVEDINQCNNYDWLILIIDADEMSAQDKTNEVETFINTNKIFLTSNCTLKIIVQKCCIETWFLGNRKVYKQNPHLSQLGNFSNFYNVHQNDPELMTKPNSYQGSLGDYHFEYLKQMLLEKHVRYSKINPSHVVENKYVTQLKKRVSETGHLPSLNEFFNFCAAISKYTSDMSTISIKTLTTQSPNFNQQLAELLAWDETDDLDIQQRVLAILADVRSNGDAAVINYTNRFDQRSISHARELELPKAALQAAWESLPAAQAEALQTAAERIRAYAEHQKIQPWQYIEADGTVLGQKITPLDSVGLYVPGGKAAYPSSVLMNAIPAKVAGVADLIMVVPTPNGETNALVLAAAYIAGVDRVFTIGGAQAVAALAYGTATIPAVAKIVGPGNIYVATAKKLVFGTVGIDMIAGPSEILVICDGKTNPDWIAMDLFSQAEHDENAQAILISDDGDFLAAVEASINALLPTMERADIIRASLEGRGALIKVQNLDEAAEVANTIAPEHLELSVENPEALSEKIRHAGAIFMGRYTAEALGDYCAGPNHVLPTSSTARFSSPLGVYDFQKRTSLINCSAAGADSLGKIASVLARGESLTAHARSAEFRIKN